MLKNHSWGAVREDIAWYCRDNHISDEDFRFLGIYEWQNVYEKMLEHFVDKDYARKNGLYWANTNGGFRKDISRIYSFQMGVGGNASYEWIERLPVIAGVEKVYLALDCGSGKYWLAQCATAAVSGIINEAFMLDDYYITDKKFNWLITENHHDIVAFIGKGLDVEKIKSVCIKS